MRISVTIDDGILRGRQFYETAFSKKSAEVEREI